MSARHLAELHAVIVHFPIALLLISVALDFAAVIFRRASLVEGASWTLLIGAPLAVAALASGWLTEHNVLTPTAESSTVLHDHKIAAILMTVVFGALFLLRLTWLLSRLLGWLRLAFPKGRVFSNAQARVNKALPQAYVTPLPRWVVVAYLLLSLIGVVLLGVTTYFGESLVYGYDVGMPLH